MKEYIDVSAGATLLDQGIEITFPPRQETGQLIHLNKVHKVHKINALLVARGLSATKA